MQFMPVFSIILTDGAIMDFYFICVRLDDSRNLLEIIHSSHYNDSKKHKIIETAYGRDEAFLLVKNLIEDFYNAGRDFNEFKGWCLK